MSKYYAIIFFGSGEHIKKKKWSKEINIEWVAEKMKIEERRHLIF